MLVTKWAVEPWLERKIRATIKEKSGNYLINIGKVHVSILHSGFELQNIVLTSKSENEGVPVPYGEIESVKIQGIRAVKALLRKDIFIREVGVVNVRITGEFPCKQDKGKPVKVSPYNIRIETLFFDHLFADLKDQASAQSFWVKEGFVKLYGIQVDQQDTLSLAVFGELDVDVLEFKTLTPDSLYTFTATGITYSASTTTLRVHHFAVQPNYTEYGFTARQPYESDRFEGGFSQVSFYDFSASDLLKFGQMRSSFIEIGMLDLHVFRDKRKEFRSIEKATFQEMIYNYPGTLHIDSIGILSGNLVYTEHAPKAIHKGSVRFTDMEAKIYKITNDTIYKTDKAYLELNANALLMGKAKLTLNLKSRIFDSQNTFAVNGRLLAMEASDLNPLLEHNAFLSLTAGKIDALHFSFSANNTKATGSLKLLYQGLELAFVNKQTGEISALGDRIKSMIANSIVLESNPMPGEAVRIGVIDYERDPEKFLFNYLFKALLSGIKASIAKPKSPKPTKR